VSHRAVTEVEIEGRRVRLSNLDKVLRPDAGFTKGQMIDHYRRISAELLPHLQERPLTLKRFPDGVDDEFFYEKRCPSHWPPWIATCQIRRRGGTGKPIDYCLVGDLPSLVWVANLASIELHSLLACCRHIDHPTMVVFDLDPGPPADLVDCCQVGLWVRDVLDGLGLQSFRKSSGSKGPAALRAAQYSPFVRRHQTVRRSIARLLAERHPDRVVERMDKSLRAAKVLTTGARTTPARPLSAPIPCVPVNVPRSPPLSPGRRSNEDCTTTTRPSYSSRQPTSSSGYGGSVTSSNRCAASNRSFLDSADLRPAS
jgi:bifunctional non-homologous end joining protein LigD